jgi:hypothetical protein
MINPAGADAIDRAMDLMIADWKRRIRKGGPALESALNSYYAALARSDEDDLIERADEIKARRAAEGFPTPSE